MMKKLFNLSFLMLFISAGLFFRCDKPRGFDDDSPRKKAFITVLSGNNQVGSGGERLADPIVVGLTNSASQPLANINLRFIVVEGEGKIIGGFLVPTGKDGRVEIDWQIGPGYNGIEVRVLGEEYEANPGYIFAAGENPTGIHQTRTIASLEKVKPNLYTITFFGDYSEILDTVNRRFTRQPQDFATAPGKQDNHCSLFSALGNPGNYFFGRSYDNPYGWNCITLLARYNPPDGYASLALSRTKEYGFDLGTEIESLHFYNKISLFEAAFYTPDGINEHGVCAGCAGVRGLRFEPDPNKKSIWITLLVREILDHAGSVDEAVKIAQQYNVFDNTLSTLATHFLVADASGRSVVLELYDGVLQVIPNEESWQVATNSPIYNVPLSERKANCWRYPIIYDSLEAAGGAINRELGLHILEQIVFKPPGTQWSSLYNLNNKTITFALDCDFRKIFHYSLHYSLPMPPGTFQN